jgi:thiol-disulfide isomerase/thioredoxin
MSLHLVEVGSTSCGVCKMMKPMVERAVSKFTPDKLTFVYINGDTEEGKSIMEKYSIDSVGKVPSFFFKIQNILSCTVSGGKDCSFRWVT